MSDGIQSSATEANEARQPNPPRRRSSSLRMKTVANNNNNVIVNSQIQRGSDNSAKNLPKYASSGNLFDSSSNAVESDSSIYSYRVKNRLNSDNEGLENLFVNWFKDPKSVKNCLSRLQEANVFKTGFPLLEQINLEEYYPPVMFLVSGPLKLDNDFEIYTINNYDVRISEFMSWSVENKKDLYDEYHKGLKAINQKVVDIANTENDQEENEKISEKEVNSTRRHSEIIGLVIANKNQPISTYLPNKSALSYDFITRVGDAFLIDQSRKTDKSLRHIILSNDQLLIFATKRAERLKFKFILRHLYCGTCSDHQIPNIDSSLRIRGPFGDDLILTFSNPNSRNQWNNDIQNSISASLEAFKTRTTEITILKNLESNPSAPLVSKVFPVTGQTTGLELKRKAIEGFNQNEKNLTDFILTFNVKGTNREYILQDDVLVMILQEHIGCSGESNSCTDACLSVGNSNVLNRTNFYLQYNPLRDAGRIKKSKLTPDAKPTKSKLYNLNDKWVENTMPNWLLMLLADLYHEGSQSEGIFRLSGICSKSDEILQTICENGDDFEIKEEIHTKANIMKKFFNAIDGSIFTLANKDKLIALSNEITSLEDFKKNIEQRNKVLNIVQTLPRNNYDLLQMFLVVINHIAKHDEINKMTLTNLSVCLAPSVLTKMSETSHEDFQRTRRLFDCILSLFEEIVEKSVQTKIVALLKKRKTSLQSNNIATSADEFSFDVNSDYKMTRSCSNAFNDSSTVKEVHPSVPPRRQKKDFNSPIDFDSSRPHLVRSKQMNIKRLERRETANVLSQEEDKDKTDSRLTTNENQGDPLPSDNVRGAPRRRKKNNTVAITNNNETHASGESYTGSRTPDALYSPFHRQTQVNRNKHRDSSISNIKIQDNDIKSMDLLDESDDINPKPKYPASRSRERTRLNKPLEKTTREAPKFTFNSKIQNNDSNSNVEPRRSSSSSKVQTMVNEIESKSKTKSDGSSGASPLPTQRVESAVKDFEIGKRITRNNNVITGKQNRVRNNVTGPIKPTRYAINNNIPRPQNGRWPNVIHRSNTIETSLKESLDSRDSKDVTYI